MSSPLKGVVLGGRYRIEELIGEGAMGRVYLAEEIKSGDKVAVKLLKSDPGVDSTGLAQRFEREGLTLQRLEHPAIVRYRDRGIHDGALYHVVEYLVGRSIRSAAHDFLGRPDKVLLLGSLLAQGMATAHEAGVVHRDLKPDNLMILDNGEPRILDFGLARWVSPDGVAPEAASTIMELTTHGALLGTVVYMSPEQLRAEPADRRSDIYSLGIVLYELAAGCRPFNGESLAALLRNIETASLPPLGSHVPALASPSGRALDVILAKALAPLPSQRFFNMGELAEACDKARALEVSIPGDATTAILIPPSVPTADASRLLVGRQEELAAFEELLAKIQEGRGGTALVEGPSGIGKSALVGELSRRSHSAGLLCCVAVTPRTGEETGFPPVLAWLRRMAEVFPREEAIHAALAAFESSKLDVLPSNLEPSAPWHDRLVAAFTNVARKVPLLLLVEDAHLASVGLLSLLNRIADAARDSRMILLLTVRSDAILNPAPERILEDLYTRAGLLRLKLGPLSAPVLQTLVERTYPGLALTDEFFESLYRQAAGNPSWVHGIMEALEARGDLQRRGGDWVLEIQAPLPSPPEAFRALEERLVDLSAPLHSTLEAAAVIGEDFETGRLAEILNETPEVIAGRLEELARHRRILQRSGTGYRFDQSFTRDAIVERIPAARLSTLHHRAGQTLFEKLGERAEPHLAAAAFSHFMRADRADEALPLAKQLGLSLRARGAPAEAVPWLEHARSLMERRIERLNEAARVSERPVLAEIEIALGEALHAVGRSSEAYEHLEKARALAQRTARQDLLSRSLTLISRTLWDRGDYLLAQRRAHESVRIARQAGFKDQLALALAAEAQSLSRLGENDQAETRYEEAISEFESLGLGARAAETRFTLGNHYFRLDRYDRAEACYKQVASVVKLDQNPRLYAGIRNSMAAGMLARSRPAEALPLFREAASIRRTLGTRREEATSLHNIAYCQHRLGNLQEAKRLYARVMDMRSELEGDVGRAASQINLAEVLLQMGELEGALSGASEAVETKRRHEDRTYLPVFLNVLGAVELELGRSERAAAAFEEIVQDFSEHTEEAGRARLGLAQTAWQSGRSAEARLRFEELGSWIPSCTDPVVALIARHALLSFLAQQQVRPDRLHSLAPASVADSDADVLPEARMYLSWIEGILAASEGRRADARRRLEEGIEAAESAGIVESIWRLRRDQALLESEGSPAKIKGLYAARDVILEQATRITDSTLRESYLHQTERAETLELASKPSSGNRAV